MKQLLLSVFLLSSIFVKAQDMIKESVNIKQDGIAIKFYVLDSDEKGVKKYDTEKYYYWFKAQKVMSTQGGSAGTLLNGKYQSFYTNSQLLEEGFFVKGLKDGVWKKWNSNGTLICTENWNNGKLSGEQKAYDDSGELTTTTIIRRNCTIKQKQDTLIEWRGNDVTTTYYDSLGNKLKIERLKDGVLHGKQESWDSEREHSVVTYKKGEVQSKKEKESSTETESGEEKTLKSRFKKLFQKKDPSEKKKEKSESAGSTDQKKKRTFHLKKQKND